MKTRMKCRLSHRLGSLGMVLILFGVGYGMIGDVRGVLLTLVGGGFTWLGHSIHPKSGDLTVDECAEIARPPLS